jgi:hypothetical protein
MDLQIKELGPRNQPALDMLPVPVLHARKGILVEMLVMNGGDFLGKFQQLLPFLLV